MQSIYNKKAPTVSVTKALPDLSRLNKQSEITGTIIASAITREFEDSLHEGDMFYKIFIIINGQMQPLNLKQFQIIGNGQTFFICTKENLNNNIYQLYNPINKTLGGGAPNFLNITAINVGDYAPISQYAYEFQNPSIYSFSSTTKEYQIYPPENQSGELDFPSSQKIWAGSIGEKNFYLVSKGTGGFSNSRREINIYNADLPDATRQGYVLDNSVTSLVSRDVGGIRHYVNLGTWYGDWIIYDTTITTSDGSNSTDFGLFQNYESDFNHPVFHKFFTPECLLYAPSIVPLGNNRIGLPHYKLDATTNNILMMLVVNSENPSVAAEKDFAGHKFFTTVSALNGTSLYLFLNDSSIANHNYFKLDSLGERSYGATIQTIYQTINNGVDVSLANETISERGDKKSLFYSQIHNLLKSNPIGKYFQVAVDVSASINQKMLVLQLGSSFSTEKSNVDFLYELQQIYGMNVSPFISGYVYGTKEIQKWFRSKTLEQIPAPPRKDGKATDLELVEFDLNYIVDKMSTIETERKTTMISGYYVRILYANSQDGWETAANNIFGFQLGPPKNYNLNNAKLWIKPQYLNSNRYTWQLSVKKQEFFKLTFKRFSNQDLTDYRYLEESNTDDDGSNVVKQGAINCGTPLFDLNTYEKVRIKKLIEDGQNGIAGGIQPKSTYQWIHLDDISIELYDNVSIPEVQKLYANNRIIDTSTVFSALDYNKLTQNFDLWLDDDHMRATKSHNSNRDNYPVYYHFTSSSASRNELDEYDLDPASYYAVTARTTEENLIPNDEDVYQNKINATIGCGRRLTHNENWQHYSLEMSGINMAYRGNGASIMPTSSYLSPLVTTEGYKIKLSEIYNSEDYLDSPVSNSLYYNGVGGDTSSPENIYYYNVLQKGYNGIYFGFQPNAAVISRDTKTGAETRKSFMYFAVPKLFDYLRLPNWLISEFDEGVYLECWTKHGWMRCPIEKKNRDVKIRMPHPRHTRGTKSRPYQDVVYSELLPLIPDNILLCGPGTQHSLPDDLGYVMSNTIYYPESSIYDTTKASNFRWKKNVPAWGSSVIDFSIRPIGGYYFRFITNIGGYGTVKNKFEGVPSIASESVINIIDFLNTPPTNPSIGDRYIIDEDPTGEWLDSPSLVNSYAEWGFISGTLGWIYTEPSLNDIIYDESEDIYLEYISDEASPIESLFWSETEIDLVGLEGEFTDPTTRDLIFRAMHTTLPQFINIVKSDCWIEDIKIRPINSNSTEIDILIAGYKTISNNTQYRTELHTVKVNNE